MAERRWRGAWLTFGIAALLALAACGDGGTGPGPGPEPKPDAQPLVRSLRANANSTCATIEDECTAFCWGDTSREPEAHKGQDAL